MTHPGEGPPSRDRFREPLNYDPNADQPPHAQVMRHVTITWQGGGGWFGRIIFGLLVAVLVIAAALVSMVVLLWLLLGVLTALAMLIWKAHPTGLGVSWTILRGKRPPN